MNRQLATIPSLPRPPQVPETLPMSSDFRRFLTRVMQFLQDLTRDTAADLQEVHDQINSAVQGVGPDIASAADISVTHPIHHVTGTNPIATINPPPGFSGPIWLIADGAFSLISGGNIAAPVTAVVDTVVQLIFDPGTEMWYPVA